MAHSTRALLVDAFTEEPLSGNAAGVVPDAADLSDRQMAAVARELGASETAFVRPSEAADRRLRFFTPTTEVDACGHATVAAHAHLHASGSLPAGEHTVETNAGVHAVTVEDDGTVWVAQSTPSVDPLPDEVRTRVADALGVPVDRVLDDLPVARASSGLPFLVVALDYLSALRAVDPDDDALFEVCEAEDAVGVYAFTFDTLAHESTVHGRAFAPRLGIPEDPVTGTAGGAVAAFLDRQGALGDADVVVCEQGHTLDRPGTVRVRFDPLRVGGRAVTALDGTLTVPDVDGDGDIVEA